MKYCFAIFGQGIAKPQPNQSSWIKLKSCNSSSRLPYEALTAMSKDNRCVPIIEIFDDLNELDEDKRTTSVVLVDIKRLICIPAVGNRSAIGEKMSLGRGAMVVS